MLLVLALWSTAALLLGLLLGAGLRRAGVATDRGDGSDLEGNRPHPGATEGDGVPVPL